MNKMRISAAVFFAIASLFLLAACESDKCKTRAVECKNQGVCNDGRCQCAAGYEGDSCQFLVNAKFAGLFGGIYAPSLAGAVPSEDTIEMAVGTGNNAIVFYHKRIHPSLAFKGTVKTNDIVIPAFVGMDGFTYKGTGSLNKDIISLTMRRDSMIGGISVKGYAYTFSGNRTR